MSDEETDVLIVFFDYFLQNCHVVHQHDKSDDWVYYQFALSSLITTKMALNTFLARLLILIKKGGLLQLKFGVVGVGVGVGVNIYLWAR